MSALNHTTVLLKVLQQTRGKRHRQTKYTSAACRDFQITCKDSTQMLMVQLSVVNPIMGYPGHREGQAMLLMGKLHQILQGFNLKPVN